MHSTTLITKKNEEFTYSFTQSAPEYLPEDIKVYGITISGKEKTASVEDISCEYEMVKALFELIVSEKLFPEHLYYAAEDFLSDPDSIIRQSG